MGKQGASLPLNYVLLFFKEGRGEEEEKGQKEKKKAKAN